MFNNVIYQKEKFKYRYCKILLSISKGYIMKTQLIRLSLAAGVILFTACGSSDDSSGSSNISGETVEITDVTSAENAASAISSVQGFTDSLQSVSGMSSNSPSRLAISKASQKMDCSYGGSMDMSGDGASGTVAYNNCAMTSSMTLDGTMSMNSSNNGNNIYSKVSFNNFSMNMGESNYFKYNVTMEMETNYSYDPMKMTMDGTLSYSLDGYAGTAGYKNFILETSGNTFEINGQTSITSSQYSCIDGVYNISTTEPLVMSYYGDNIESGKMVVNGATYSFNSDGTANVTFSDGSTAIVEIDDTPSCTGN